MKILRDLCVVLSLFLVASLILGATNVNNRMLIKMEYETTGERHWFVTVNGAGDCTSWDNACTFRTAVGRCTSGVLDVVHVGVGEHDLDNGSDATGTTISADYVAVYGQKCAVGSHTTLINSAAVVTNVLTGTGAGLNLEYVEFDQSGETDTDATLLNIQGEHGSVTNCSFEQTAGAAGQGLLIDNSAMHLKIRDSCFYGLLTEGIKIDGATRVAMRNLKISNCAKGLSIVGASDSEIRIKDSFIKYNTLGFEHTGATTSDILVYNCKFVENTTSITDTGEYDAVHYQKIEIAHAEVKILPATDGVAVATGDGIWTWTAAAVQIVAADTINNPFAVIGINIQTYDVAQTFKIELLYGEATADNAVGIYEFTVGAAVANQLIRVYLPNQPNVLTPATSGLWAKSMSSTAGVDSVTFTISYTD